MEKESRLNRNKLSQPKLKLKTTPGYIVPGDFGGSSGPQQSSVSRPAKYQQHFPALKVNNA
jgi:hypothetical protein